MSCCNLNGVGGFDELYVSVYWPLDVKPLAKATSFLSNLVV